MYILSLIVFFCNNSNNIPGCNGVCLSLCLSGTTLYREASFLAGPNSTPKQ